MRTVIGRSSGSCSHAWRALTIRSSPGVGDDGDTEIGAGFEAREDPAGSGRKDVVHEGGRPGGGRLVLGAEMVDRATPPTGGPVGTFGKHEKRVAVSEGSGRWPPVDRPGPRPFPKGTG